MQKSWVDYIIKGINRVLILYLKECGNNCFLKYFLLKNTSK